MKRFLVGLYLALAALLTPLTVGATPTLSTSQMQELVSSVGCTATVTSSESSSFNAAYIPWGHRIITIGFENLPARWQQLILLHEAGHCLQSQNGEFQTLLNRGPYEIEWDADAFAIRKMGELYGVDAADLNHEVWAYLYHEYGYEGDLDDSHGLSVERITRGNLNRTTPRIES
jgi:hypothetical protein